MINWRTDYPDEISLESEEEFRPPKRAELQKNRCEVFVDIYGLLKHLMAGGNVQIQGRRGVGKTMYLLHAHEQLAKSFGEDHRVLTAYVDLSALDYEHRLIDAMYLAVNSIYRAIICDLLGSEKQPIQDVSNDQPVCKLAYFLDRGNFFKRGAAHRALKGVKRYLDGQGDRITTLEQFEQVMGIERNLELTGDASLSISTAPEPVIGSGLKAQKRISDKLLSKRKGLFYYNTKKVHDKLIKLLDVIHVDRAIVFLDEFNVRSLPRKIQPYLIERLVKTFDGNRLCLKIATVPGASFFSKEDSHGSFGVSLDKHFYSFDFDTELQKYPDRIRTGNFEIFLKNAAAYKSEFRQYLQPITPKEEGFNCFVKDMFVSKIDFHEFLNAGEGLPRQLADIYFDALFSKLTHDDNKKITKQDIWAAANRDYYQKKKNEIDTQDSENKVASLRVLSRIAAINNRIVKLEMVPEYLDTVEQLTALGFVNACSATPIYEKEVSRHPLEYYYTSYRTEVANQIMLINTKINDRANGIRNIHIEDMTYIPKDKSRWLYQRAKLVRLKDPDKVIKK